MHEQDNSNQLRDQVETSYGNRTELAICGGGSKSFYGRQVTASKIDVSSHCGIVNYEPTELTITARAGTPVKEIEAVLAGQNQMLAFEPPGYNDNATLGGTIACNLSGPRRAYSGAARDFVLGCKIINGRGEILSFGGEVMKNVAGYDVSRLMAGAMGTLGILLEVSLKVLPLPEMETTLVQDLDAQSALDQLHQWGQLPLPVSASCYVDGQLHVRLSGAERAVQTAAGRLGGEHADNASSFWNSIKEQQHVFFKTDSPLWRLSVDSASSPDMNCGDILYEWGGALRWVKSDDAGEKMRAASEKAGGHAICYRNSRNSEVFHPLSDGLFVVHKKLKAAFDPAGILNPGRMYPDL